MTQYASITHGEAWMGKEFGERTARRLFGDAIVDALPRNTKGKYAGKLKTTLCFRKVEKGGWVSEGFGHVERRVGKIISAEIVLQPFRGAPEVLHSWQDDPRAPIAADLAQAVMECPDNTTRAAQRAIEIMYRRQDAERAAK